MKKLLVLIVLAVFGAGTMLQAQTAAQDKAAVKAAKEAEKQAKEAEKKARKAAEAAQSEAWYNAAVKAMEDKEFVLEANRIEFKRGSFVYVTPTTNFVSLEGNHATIQLAFNTGAIGPNGLGGITVDGNASGIEMTKDKKGNISFKMMVQGSSVSATVTIRIMYGTNQATATVSPNFSSNRISFTGTLYPEAESSIFKGRTLF